MTCVRSAILATAKFLVFKNARYVIHSIVNNRDFSPTIDDIKLRKTACHI